MTPEIVLMVVAGLMDAALFLTCLGVVMSVRQWRRQTETRTTSAHTPTEENR